MGSARVSRAGDGVLAIANFLDVLTEKNSALDQEKVRCGGTPQPTRETRALPRRDTASRIMSTATFKIWRGDANGGAFRDYTTEISEGMVVLDAVHDIQAKQAGDLACRWNCKAGKCGSCSAEVNGMPKLMCMTRMSDLPLDKPITIEPMKAFPVLKDLITDVSWNFAVKKRIKKFKPRPPDAADGTWRMQQQDIDRVQEFRKCIECFLCQDVCHVLRDHHMHDKFIGPRFLIYAAALECIHSIPRIASRNCARRTGSDFATSRNAAPKFVRKILRSPTTASFR